MAQAMLDSENFGMINLLPTPTTNYEDIHIMNEKPDVIQNKLNTLESHMTVIRSHLEKKPVKMTLATISNKLDHLLMILEKNGFNVE